MDVILKKAATSFSRQDYSLRFVRIINGRWIAIIYIQFKT